MRHRLTLKHQYRDQRQRQTYLDDAASVDVTIPLELYVELGRPSTIRAILDTSRSGEIDVTVHPDLTDRRGLWPRARRTR